MIGVLFEFDGQTNTYKIAVEEKRWASRNGVEMVKCNFVDTIRALDVTDLGFMSDAEELLTHNVEDARKLGLKKFMEKE